MGMFENSEIAAVRRQNEQKTGGFSAENGEYRHQMLSAGANLRVGHRSTKLRAQRTLQAAILSVLPCRRSLLPSIIDGTVDEISDALNQLAAEKSIGTRVCAITFAEVVCDRRRSEHLTSRGNAAPRSESEKTRIGFLFRGRR